MKLSLFFYFLLFFGIGTSVAQEFSLYEQLSGRYDYVAFGSESKVKEAGKMRVEGKEYIVKDGDVMHFRFNV